MAGHQYCFIIVGADDFSGHFAGGQINGNAIYITSFPEVVNCFDPVAIFRIYVVAGMIVHDNHQVVIIDKTGIGRIKRHTTPCCKIAAVIRTKANAGPRAGVGGTNLFYLRFI